MDAPGDPGRNDGRIIRHAVRTFLNNIAGYGEVLREEAEATARSDLVDAYASVVSNGGALRDFILPCFRTLDEGGPGIEERAQLVRESYSLIYDIIARVQSIKNLVAGESRFVAETEIILDASNSLVELLEGRLAEDRADHTWTEDIADEAPDDTGPRRIGRILIVDDSPFHRDLLARHLERQGHEVIAVNEGGLALQILKSAAFDIVILDVMLPGMTGFELIGRIKENEEIGNLYVLVVSAFDDTESVARCIQLGAEDYLPRDFEPIILRARIESCLEKKLLREMEALYIAAVTEGEKRLRAELQEGAAYVRGLLPARIDETGLASDWIFIPSLSLGGDAFGYHHVGADRTRFQLALYLIDVSGHGIEAALYSVTLMNLLKSQVLTGTDFADPASVLSHLNQSFKIEDQNNLFFSAWYGVWDGGTRKLTYSSAGSPPALVRVANGSLIPLVTGGPIVGAIDDASYENRMEELTEGSALYLFSDGVFEIRQQDGRILGLEGFSGMLKEAAALDLGETLPALVVGLQGLSKSGRFEDDVSLLEFRFG